MPATWEYLDIIFRSSEPKTQGELVWSQLSVIFMVVVPLSIHMSARPQFL